MKNRTTHKSLGQAMSEYLIITGMVAFGALVAFYYFGSVSRQQTANTALALSGKQGVPISAQGWDIASLFSGSNALQGVGGNGGASALGAGGGAGSSNSAGSANSGIDGGNAAGGALGALNGGGASALALGGGNATGGTGSAGGGLGAGGSAGGANSSSGGGSSLPNLGTDLFSNLANFFASGPDTSNSWEDLLAPGKDAGMPQCMLQAGNPINVANGLKYQREVDYASPVGLDFIRHYNSKLARAYWQHNWQQQVWLNAQQNLAEVTRPDGKRYIFRLQQQRWVADADVNDVLSRSAQGWRYQRADGAVEEFDAQGRLSVLASNDGHRYTLQYDAAGLLHTIADAQHQLTLSYDSLARLIQLRDPAGGVYRYAYDAQNNLQTVIYPDASSKTYHYGDSRFVHALTGISDENAKRFATWHYDAQGRAVSSEHAHGVEKVSLTFNDAHSTTVTDAEGHSQTRYFQDILGMKRATGTSQPSGSGCAAAVSRVTYDAAANVLSRSNFNGNKTCYAYDTQRNLELYRLEGVAADKACPSNLANYQPSGVERKISTQWHAFLRQPTVQASPLLVTRYEYDAQGKLSGVTEQATLDSNGGQGFEAQSSGQASSHRLQYNAQGLVSLVDGPRHDVADLTHYTYDSAGNLTQVRNALNQTVHINQYDAHGRPIRWTDANQQTVQLFYDARGRLLRSVRGAEITHYQYDAATNLTRLVLANGASYQFVYDDAHRLIRITDGAGNQLDYHLDKLGNRIREQVSAGGTVVYRHQREFDALNRLWKDIDAFNQVRSFAYDAHGNVNKINLPEADYQQVNQYDVLNRLVQRINPQQQSTELQYDARNQVTAVSDARQLSTRYHRDGLGNSGQRVSPDSGVTNSQFDAAGNLISRTDANQLASHYRYDALNRLISTQFSGVAGQDIRYQYDEGDYAAGLLSSMQDASGLTRYRYNAQGKLSSQTVSLQGKVYQTQYSYDNAGRLRELSYPSGRKVHYQFDAQGRIRQISTSLGKQQQIIIDQVQYWPFSGVQRFVYADGKQAYQRGFDLNGRIQSYTLNGQTYQIHYDALSRIRRVQSTDQPAIEYDYDAANRLTAYRQNFPISFAYDDSGNRTAQQFGATNFAYHYAPGSNRLISTQLAQQAPERLRYDAAGLLQQSGQQHYYYDAQGYLTRVDNPQGSTRFAVNALGQRMRKQSALSDTLYHYDQQGLLIAETSLDNKSTASEYVYLGDLLVGVIQNKQVYFVHNDQLNTPRVITNQQAQVVWQWRNTDPFANNPPSVEKISFNLRFPGQYADHETGLFYNNLRHYDPARGRYIQADPAGLRGGVNAYAYVENNPLSYTDPIGLWSTAAHNAILDAFGKFWRFTPEQIQALKNGSREADSMKYQGPEFSYMHAMSSAALSQAQACERYNIFVGNTMAHFKARIATNDILGAFHELGFRLHAVMDDVSPAHRNFQEWSYGEMFSHGPFPTSIEDLDSLTPELLQTAVARINAVSTKGKVDCSCYGGKK